MLERLGVAVTTFPYELHPWIPTGGVSFEERWGDRLDAAVAMYERVAAECAAVGQPFRRPERIPNTRRALETATLVARHAPDAFPDLDRALFLAHFVDGLALGDPDVVDALVAGAGVEPGPVRAAVEAGEAREGLESSLAVAGYVGVDGTPAWLIDGRVLLHGLQPRQAYEDAVAGREAPG